MIDLKEKLRFNLNFLKSLDERAIDETCAQIALFKQILNEFNGVHNLSKFKDLDAEIIDSLKILDFDDFFMKFASFDESVKICDIGSGAGFPALFIALFSRASFYLFEPSIKKSAFLRSVKIALQLKNVNIIKQKAQDFKPQNDDFKARIITSRALMRVKNLLEICAHLRDENTQFILYKGSELENELKEAQKLFQNTQVYENKFRKYCVLS